VDKQFEGKIAVVTGDAGGIGLEAARVFVGQLMTAPAHLRPDLTSLLARHGELKRQ